MWDMETASRRQIVWASPTPPFGKMTDNVSKSADSYLPKASTCDSSWVLVIPVYTFKSKLESTVLVSILMDTLIGMGVLPLCYMNKYSLRAPLFRSLARTLVLNMAGT